MRRMESRHTPIYSERPPFQNYFPLVFYLSRWVGKMTGVTSSRFFIFKKKLQTDIKYKERMRSFLYVCVNVFSL